MLLPERFAAVIAARANHIQTSLNLALGSAIASIGLTIPVVAAVSLYLGQELTVGLGMEEMALLLLTLFVSSLTLASGRATILQGAVHLVIFGVFLLLAAVPLARGGRFWIRALFSIVPGLFSSCPLSDWDWGLSLALSAAGVCVRCTTTSNMNMISSRRRP